MLLIESMMVALVGAAAGLLLAIVYNRLVFNALNGVWKDVVRTEMMHMDVNASTLVTGLLATLVVAFFALYFPLTRKLKRQFRKHLAAGKTRRIRLIRRGLSMQRISAVVFISTGLVALGLIATQLLRLEVVMCQSSFWQVDYCWLPPYSFSNGIWAGLINRPSRGSICLY